MTVPPAVIERLRKKGKKGKGKKSSSLSRSLKFLSRLAVAELWKLGGIKFNRYVLRLVSTLSRDDTKMEMVDDDGKVKVERLSCFFFFLGTRFFEH